MGSAGADPTRRCVIDHLLGPVADMPELSDDAAAAVAITAVIVLGTALGERHFPERRLVFVSGRGNRAARPALAAKPERSPLR